MDSQIAKKNQSLTTAEEMRNQTMLVMQPYANWEEYLTPAPLSIAILGELVYISSNTDFSINKNSPKDGYNYIRYPDSFRACLMQVCNSGWGAFNEAHKNMDQIRLNTLAVPDYMKTAVKILFQGNDEVVQAHLPDQLENIRVIADDCLQLATSTEKRFNDVINIVQELLEASLNAKHFYGEELDAIKKKLDEAKLRKQSSEEAAVRSERIVQLMENQMQEAQESYSKAMDSLPGEWNMLAMDVVESITEGFTTLVNGLASLSPLMLLKRETQRKTQRETPESSADCVDEINIYCKSSVILSCTENVQGFIKGNTISWKELYDQKHQTTKTNFYAQQFERIKEDLTGSPNCNAKSAALKPCEEAIEICEELAKYAPEGNCEETTTKELIERIRNLNESARRFDSKSKAVTNTPALTPKPPMMNKIESPSIVFRLPRAGSRGQQSKQGCPELAKYAPEGNCKKEKKESVERIRNLNDSARSFDSKSKAVTNSPALTPKPPMMNKIESTSENLRTSDNARFKIEQSRAQLDKTRETYMKSAENMEKNQKELTEILITMRSCEVKEIDFKTTIEMLMKGMDAMGRVKEQWEKMVRFFQMVSNIMKTSLTRTLKDFVTTSEKTQKLTYNSKLFTQDLLYMQAFQATNIANLINMISTTYTEVSDKHLMDRVSSLGKLMVMDKTKPDYLIEVERLRNSCDEAQKAILALVLKNKEEFERKCIARQEKIDQELRAILPAAAPEEEKRIQEAVQRGFTDEEEEDYI